MRARMPSVEVASAAFSLSPQVAAMALIKTFRSNPPPLPIEEVAEAYQFLQSLCADNSRSHGAELPRRSANPAASPPKYRPFFCFAKPLTTTSRAGGDCITSMSGLDLQRARVSEIVSLALCLSIPYFSEGSGGALSGERRKCVACSNE